MKLTDAERLSLYKVALAGVLSREKWPDSTPPAKDGTTKKVNPAFAVCTWAAAVMRASEYVLSEKDGQAEGGWKP